MLQALELYYGNIMSYIRRIGYRHLDAIRFQVCATMTCIFADRPRFSFPEWVRKEFPSAKFILDQVYFQSISHENKEIWKHRSVLDSALREFESNSDDEDIQFHFRDSMVSTSLSDHYEEDMHGTDLAGEWDYNQFVLRGGIVASLGALEEFERGVLRILYQYKSEEVEYFSYRPRLRHFRTECEAWKQIKSNANAVDRRRKLFKEFNICVTAQEAWFTKLSDIRKKRHLYAHGMGSPKVTFQDFVECQHNVYKCILLICRNTYRATDIEL